MTDFSLGVPASPYQKKFAAVNVGSAGKKGTKLVEPGEGSEEQRPPRRVLYFSDGTLEEYSTDEEDEEADAGVSSNAQLISSSDLSWASWFGYQVSSTGSKALAACDYVGENLAYYLGITSPKYQYELEEHQRALKEEEEEKRQASAAMMGWKTDGDGSYGTSSLATPSTLTPLPSLPEMYGLESLRIEEDAGLREEATPVPTDKQRF
ncbi:FAM177 family [Trinorchestia longiramus]|nr:FAM177 family [Trinorchestia longiramus]